MVVRMRRGLQRQAICAEGSRRCRSTCRLRRLAQARLVGSLCWRTSEAQDDNRNKNAQLALGILVEATCCGPEMAAEPRIADRAGLFGGGHFFGFAFLAH
jgi:hypothetical protein